MHGACCSLLLPRLQPLPSASRRLLVAVVVATLIDDVAHAGNGRQQAGVARQAPGMCPEGAWKLPERCPGEARGVPRACPRGARDVPGRCPGGARVVPGRCPGVAREMPGRCPRIAFRTLSVVQRPAARELKKSGDSARSCPIFLVRMVKLP